MKYYCWILFLLSLGLFADNKYNVLFIAIDDMRPELNCLGVDYAQTPHMDKLSKEGAVFENHYVQVATCGSSRYALLTGRSPFYSGAYGNASMTSGKTAVHCEKLDFSSQFPLHNPLYPAPTQTTNIALDQASFSIVFHTFLACCIDFLQSFTFPTKPTQKLPTKYMETN